MGDFRPDYRRLTFVNPDAGTFAAVLRIISASSAYPHTLVAMTAATYTVLDEDGTIVYGPVNATIVSSQADIQAAIPAGFVAGKVYREKWVCTITGLAYTPIFFAPLWVVGLDSDNALITTETILAMHPTLSIFPPGLTSWEGQIRAAHRSVCLRAMTSDMRRQIVWSAAQLERVETYTALAIIFRQAATFTGGPALEMAQYYEKAAADEWRSLRVDVDTDGDGDVDANVQSGTDARFPGGPLVTR